MAKEGLLLLAGAALFLFLRRPGRLVVGHDLQVKVADYHHGHELGGGHLNLEEGGSYSLVATATNGSSQDVDLWLSVSHPDAPWFQIASSSRLQPFHAGQTQVIDLPFSLGPGAAGHGGHLAVALSQGEATLARWEADFTVAKAAAFFPASAAFGLGGR